MQLLVLYIERACHWWPVLYIEGGVLAHQSVVDPVFVVVLERASESVWHIARLKVVQETLLV